MCQDRTRRAIASDASLSLSSASRPPCAGGVDDAVRHVLVEQAEGDRLERLRHRGDLGEDVDAVLLLLDHPLQPAGLALDPAQPLEVVVLARAGSRARAAYRRSWWASSPSGWSVVRSHYTPLWYSRKPVATARDGRSMLGAWPSSSATSPSTAPTPGHWRPSGRSITGWNVYYDDDPEVVLAPSYPNHGIGMLFIPVPEGKTAKNRIHLDVSPETGTRDELVETAVAAGATVIGDHRTRRRQRLGHPHRPRGQRVLHRARRRRARHPRPEVLQAPRLTLTRR